MLMMINTSRSNKSTTSSRCCTFARLVAVFLCCILASSTNIVHGNTNRNDVLDIMVNPKPVGRLSLDFLSLTADSSRFIGTGTTVATILRSPQLKSRLQALSPLTLRVGGTYTDMTVFPGPAPGISPTQTQYNFSYDAWSAINDLAGSLSPKAKVVVSVSGLLRQWDTPGLAWDNTNALSFINHNIAKGYDIFGYELGNEPGCWRQHGGSVTPQQHAADFAVLQHTLATAYTNTTPPLVIGPDTTGCGSYNMFEQILSYKPMWNISTIHIYSLSPAATVAEFVKASQENKMCISATKQLLWLQNSTLAHTELWNGEGGASYLTTGGGFLHQFGGALSLLNNIGCLSRVGVTKFLKHDLFENMFTPPTLSMPYPTFFAVLAFKRLINNNDDNDSNNYNINNNNNNNSNHNSSGSSSNNNNNATTKAIFAASVPGAPAGLHVYAFGKSTVASLFLILNLDNASVSIRLPTSTTTPTTTSTTTTARSSSRIGVGCRVDVFTLSHHGVAASGGDPIQNAPGLAINGEEMKMNGSTVPSLPSPMSVGCDSVFLLAPSTATVAIIVQQT